MEARWKVAKHRSPITKEGEEVIDKGISNKKSNQHRLHNKCKVNH